MASLHYLTVQDFLWIHLQLVKRPEEYNFARLEEAVFYQYAYGQSEDTVGQAARLLSGFAKMKPMLSANKATTFVGVLSFLAMNGHEVELNDEEAGGWVETCWQNAGTPTQEVQKVLSEAHVHLRHGVPNSHEIVTHILESFPLTLAKLVADEPTAVLMV